MHLTQYLNFYLENIPQGFAVMLNGEWGSGKTFFINTYKSEFSKKYKFIYVSLYGVSKNSEIEDQIFQQLHPFLSSKPVSIATKVLKGAVKFGLKIDLDSNGTKETSANINLPDVQISDFYKNAENAVLIFDDLERCSIPVENILGYINHFVEHQNHRVIVIANEEEIIKFLPKINSKYFEIKEKLVGRTFSVKSDTKAALSSFIDSVDKIEVKNLLTKNLDLILRTYEASTYENLRSLKQAIIEFPRLYEQLPIKAKKHDELISNAIQTLLILSFEVRKGTITIDQIKTISTHAYTHILEKDKNVKNPLQELEKKYTSFYFEKMCPTDLCWHLFFKDGSVPNELMNQSIENSTYFRNENAENWVKLWYFNNLEENEFSDLIEIVKKDLNSDKYLKPGIIKHIAGLYFYFSKNKMISMNLKQTHTWIKNEIKRIHKSGKLELEKYPAHRDEEFYASLGFYEKKSPEFVSVALALKKLTDQEVNKKYPLKAGELCSWVTTDSRKFWETLSYRFPNGQNYSRVPILSFINTADFLAAYLNCPNYQKDNISYAFKDRYSFSNYNKELKNELAWLKKLKILFLTKSKISKPLTKNILYNFCVGSLDPAIKLLSTNNET